MYAAVIATERYIYRLDDYVADQQLGRLPASPAKYLSQTWNPRQTAARTFSSR